MVKGKLNQWKMCVGHYEKMEKMTAILQKLIVQQNFQLSTSQSLGLHFSLCQWKQKMGIGHYEKNGCHFAKTHHTGKFPITNPPPKFGSLLSLVMMETENRHQPSWKKMEKWLPFHKNLSYSKISNYQSPKSLGLRFFSVYSTSHLCVALHFLILFIVFSHRPGIIYSRLC